MKKMQDQTIDLTGEGIAARCRIRIFESEGEQQDAPERVLLMTWQLPEPGLPLDGWVEQITDQVLDSLRPSCGTLLLLEHYPERHYQVGNLTIDFAEEIHQARLRPQPGGRFALLSFGAIGQTEVEAILGEPLDALMPEEVTR